MFDWLSDLFGGIGNFFGDIFDALGSQLSAAIWDMMIQWFYTAIFNSIAEFFTTMGNLGVEIFDLEWVKAALHLFYLFGWALFTVGMVVAIFDVAIESQTGRVNIKTTALNILKGFMAASLVTVVPLELYKFCVTLQNTFSGDLTRVFAGQQHIDLGDLAMSALNGSFEGQMTVMSLYNILFMIAFAYCVIKIFFSVRPYGRTGIAF